MAKSKSVESKEHVLPVSSKKSTNPLVFIGAGCVLLIVVFSLVSYIIGTFVAKKIGSGIVQKVIEDKTGVKANIEDLEEGKMTFTDAKTGTTVNIGSGEVPSTFPKDFPLYPGYKVTSAMSGAANGKKDGFWLTLSTSDPSDKVVTYYKFELEKNGWTLDSTFTANDMTTETIRKGSWKGSLSIGKTSSESETQIVIILGEDE